MMESPVSSMFSLYLERSDLRPASIQFKQRACDLFVEWFGDPPVGRVTQAMAQDYRSMLGRQGRRPEGRSKSSVRGYLDNFRPFWKWLRSNGYIGTDPFAGVTVIVDEEPLRETFTAPELGRLMMVSDPLDRIRNCLGLLGVRRGEMLNLQVGDVFLDHPCPHAQLRRKTQTAQTWPWGTKSHRPRLVALPETMAFDGVTVELHTEIRRRLLSLGHDPEAYLCVPWERVTKLLDWQRRGELKWDDIKDPTGNYARSFRLLQQRAGIAKPRRYHELRAAFTTAMLDNRIDALRVARLVGHADVKQTMRYDRRMELSLAADAAAIAARIYQSQAG